MTKRKKYINVGIKIRKKINVEIKMRKRKIKKCEKR